MTSNRWLILVVLFLARTAMSLQFQTVPAVGPLIIEAYQIDFTWLGTLIGLYMLPGTVVAAPSGVLGQRFGAKSIVILSLALMAIGGAMSASESFALAVAGRLIAGIGGIAMSIMLTKMVTDWFAGKEIVTAMSLLISSWPLGIGLALASFPPIAIAWSWHAVMWLVAAFAVLCLALIALLYRDPLDAPPEQVATLRILLTRREWVLASLSGLIWGLFNVGYIVLVSFSPELFTQRGYSLTSAGSVASLLGWGAILFVPLAGFAADRFQRPNLFMASGFILATALSAMLPFVGSLLPVFVAIVIVASLPAGLIVSLPTQVLFPKNRAIGMGVFFTWFYLCMAMLPAVAGKFRDLSGDPAAPTLFASAMMASALVALIWFRAIQDIMKP